MANHVKYWQRYNTKALDVKKNSLGGAMGAVSKGCVTVR